MDNLTRRERELIDTALSGGVLECSQLPVDQLEATDDPACTIRAELLRALLLQRCGKPLDPRGIRLHRARITGGLDLGHVHAAIGLELQECSLDEPVSLKWAQLPWLSLSGTSVPVVDGDGIQVDGNLELSRLGPTDRDKRCVVRLVGARIGGQLSLLGAELFNPDGPAFRGDSLEIGGDLFLEGLRVTGHGPRGAVGLARAHVRGYVGRYDMELTNGDGPALDGEGLQVEGGLFLEGLRASGCGERGAVRLVGARVRSEIYLVDTELINEGGPALCGDRLEVNGDLFLTRLTASGRGNDGAVSLQGAHVTGQLNISSGKLINENGPALHADGLQVDRNLFLPDLHATGYGELGTVRLVNARIIGELSMKDAVLFNKDGPALGGDRLHVNGNLVLRKLRATVGGDLGYLGAVRMPDAHIIGQLNLSSAALTNETGPAFHGDALQVESGLFLGAGLQASGGGTGGAIELVGARITDQLVISTAKLTNPKGPALRACRLQVNGDISIGERSRVSGRGEDGAVALSYARITGQLSISDADLINEEGPALLGDGLRVDDDLHLKHGFKVFGSGERGAVRLVGARIAGELSLLGASLTNHGGLVLDLTDVQTKSALVPAQLICSEGKAGSFTYCKAAGRLRMSGFVYTSIDKSRWHQWLHLILHHTDEYQSQPYQQLAAVQRAAGHDSDARKILIAQQKDLRKRGELGGWLAKTVHRLWGALGGYGYRTRRIALALLVVLLASGAVGVVAGHTHTDPGRYVAMHVPQADNPNTPCSLLEQIGVGIDRGLPLGATGIRNRCDFDTTSRWGQVITAATWVLQALVWALATLVVAGYVGLIRKAT
jgi:hypothetical protein